MYFFLNMRGVLNETVIIARIGIGDLSSNPAFHLALMFSLPSMVKQ